MPNLALATLALASITAVAAADSHPGLERTVIFPPDAVIDITAAPYKAPNDGEQDATAAIQAALDANANGNKVIYLPKGTYLVSDTLRWGDGKHGGMAQKRTILQGAGVDRTVIRLADGAPGFDRLSKGPKGAEQAKAVIWCGRAPAQRFRNGIRDLTVHIGQNAKATGIQYIANNQGSMRYVRIVAPEGQGHVGLDLAYTDEQGPCYIQHVWVHGFDIGITNGQVVDGTTFEHVRTIGQRECGMVNQGQCLSIRGFVSINRCTAFRNLGANSLTMLLESEFTGGDDEVAAVVNTGYLTVRDLRTDGYASAIDSTIERKTHDDILRQANDGRVDFFLSHDPYLMGNVDARLLALEVQESPDAPLLPLDEWADPRAFGGDPDDKADDSAAIQAAIDSGKKGVYLPIGTQGWRIDHDVVLRNNVMVFTANENGITGAGSIRVGNGSAPMVWITRINLLYQGVDIVVDVDRPFVLSGTTMGKGHVDLGPAKRVYLDDVCMGSLTIGAGQRVWARQLNIEHQGGHKLLNDGGELWVLGYKTEQHGIVAESRNGAKTEILGGFIYAQGKPKDSPMFVVDDAELSATLGEVSWDFAKQGYHVLCRATIDGHTEELTGGAKAGRWWHANGASAVPLLRVGK